MKDLLLYIRQNSLEIFETTKNYYRTIHANPDLSFKEYNTSKFIATILRNNGIQVYEGIGKTGIIGIIEGYKPGKTIGIRAELDALPINESTNLEFSSKNKGVMHACGHDIHMASLLGTALTINKFKDTLSGKILFIFQPGEEQIPGGAKDIISSRIFESNRPDIMLAFHVLPELEAGKAGFCEGRYMASGDEIYIKVIGKGGHGALPKTFINPLIISSHLLLNLQSFLKIESPQDIPSVLTFGKIHGDGATNIVPNEVYLEGTFRTMDENWRATAHRRINEIAKNTCMENGGDCIVEIRNGYPSIFNDTKLTTIAKGLADEYLGPQNVKTLDKRMTTDDFAYFTQLIPSVFFRMGVGFSDQSKYQLHTPEFKANEDVLKHSSGLMSWLILKMSSNT